MAAVFVVAAGAVAMPAAEVVAAPPPADLDVPVSQDPKLGGNPAFLEVGDGIVAVDCQLPPWSMDPESMAAFYQAAVGCHDVAWADTLTHFGITPASPQLWAAAEAASYDGACGSNTTGREAFYCNVDQSLVLPFDSMSSIAQYGPGYAFAVLSHEYGHHLQQEFGIMDAYGARRQAVGWDTEEGLLLSRQFELQAWCLSGMFFGMSTGRASLDQAMLDQANENNAHAGDRPGEARQHGTGPNVTNWFSWGQHPALDPAADVQPSLYECNPWAARDAGWLE